MHSIQRVASSAALTLAALAAHGVAAAAGVVYEVDIVSADAGPIASVAVARAGSTHFHRAAFSARPAHDGGERATVIVRDDGAGCVRDLRVALADGRVLTSHAVDLCGLRAAARNLELAAADD